MLRRGPGTRASFSGTEHKENGTCTRDVHSNLQQAYEDNCTRKAYEIRRTQERCGYILDFVLFFYPVFMCFNVIRLCSGKITAFEFMSMVTPCSLLISVVFTSRRYLRQLSKDRVAFAVFFQTGLWIIVTFSTLFASLAMTDELNSHRTFLTMLIPTHSTFIIVGYVPLHVYVPFHCVLTFMVWLAFHWAVGFLNAPCIIYGFLFSGFTLYTYQIIDRHTWNEYLATQALDQERQYLQAINEAFDGVLFSVFDASCTCDQAGKMISWTPQLKDLLGGHGQDGPCLQLCDLADAEESSRLHHFLNQISRQGNHRAQTIQTSLRTVSSVEGSNAHGSESTGSMEVKLFGIRLPTSARETPCKSNCIFIGFQRQGDTSIVTPLADATDNCVISNTIAIIPQALAESPNADDGNDSVLGSLSYTIANNSDIGTHQSSTAKQNVAPIQLKDAAVQTDHQRRPPRPTQDLTREQQFETERQSKPEAPLRVTSKSSKRVLRKFDETPRETLVASMLEMAKTVNARGRGCCDYHVTVAKIVKAAATLASLRCSHEFRPYDDWQCHRCKSMNVALIESDADDEPACCSTCDTERVQWQPSLESGSDSGHYGDVEKEDFQEERLLERRMNVE